MHLKCVQVSKVIVLWGQFRCMILWHHGFEIPDRDVGKWMKLPLPLGRVDTRARSNNLIAILRHVNNHKSYIEFDRSAKTSTRESFCCLLRLQTSPNASHMCISVSRGCRHILYLMFVFCKCTCACVCVYIYVLSVILKLRYNIWLTVMYLLLSFIPQLNDTSHI